MFFPNRTSVWLLNCFVAAACLPAIDGAALIAKTTADRIGVRHPLTIVKGDVYVGRTRTTMRLICFAEDLEMLQGVEAYDDGMYDPQEIKDATQDHADYLAQRIVVRDIQGRIIKPEISEIIDVEIPETGIPSGKLMEYTMEFVLEFKYESPPEFLTIEQNMVAEGALLPSEFHVLLKQAGSDKPYSKTLKPQTAETFRFDWDRPVLNESDSQEQWKAWFADQREKTLGITSYGSVYSFIYITDREVRHEVLVPLATLASLMEFQRQDSSFLDVDEQVAAADKIKSFFAAGNPVMIDGIEVKPVFDRVDFYGLDIRDFAVRPEKRKVSMANGRVGVIMTYSAKQRPSQVSVQWDLYSDSIREVDVSVIAYNDVSQVTFSQLLPESVFRWQAPDRPELPPITGLSGQYDLAEYSPRTITLSWVSIGLTGLALACLLVGLLASSQFWVFAGGAVVLAGLAWSGSSLATATYPHPFREAKAFEITPAEATDIFGRLHHNMFRAFDYRDESDVYDALSKSVDGELLRRLYLQINESLRIKQQGGAIAVIDQVELVDGQLSAIPDSADPKSPVRFGYHCDWKLNGRIEHWGHIHERENGYSARFLVELVQGPENQELGWKITAMSDQDFRPGKVRRSLRKF